jgi:hypothetical protein
MLWKRRLVRLHVNPLIETVNKQQKTITEQAQTLSKQAAIITTLQTTAKDHTLALKEHSTEVNAIFSERIGMILLRTSGLVRASNTLSVIVFLVLGALLGMMSVRSEIEFRRLICRYSWLSKRVSPKNGNYRWIT